jgi:hypothetical protein
MKKGNKRNLTVGILYLTIALFALYIFIMFFVIGVDHAPMVKGKMKNHDFSLSAWKWFFYPHLLLGMISLAIGPFQLTKKSQGNPKLHKSLGKIYAVAIFLNILMVPYLTVFATGGTPSTVAFLVLDVFWLWTTAMGVIMAVKRKISKHKEWIFRSYAITWVFVTFRIVLIPFSIFLDSSAAFPIAVYLAIALNLGFVEWKNRKKKKNRITGQKITPAKPIA